MNTPVLSLTAQGVDPGYLPSGTPFPIVGGELNFTTGNLLSVTSNSWIFGTGGSITVTGTLPNTTTPDVVLFSGVFTQDTTITEVGGNFLVVGSGFRGTLNSILAADFNFASGLDSGALSFTFSASGFPGSAIANTTLLSGDTSVNTFSAGVPSVPEPASAAMMGIGAVAVGSFMGLSRLKRRAA
jgi:hypothetical protein